MRVNEITQSLPGYSTRAEKCRFGGVGLGCAGFVIQYWFRTGSG
jgi:hypothetical protein